MKNNNFIKELNKQRKELNNLLKPKIDYDKEYDIFYLWFGGKRKVDSTIEVSQDMRFDITEDGTIVSVEIEGLLKKLRVKNGKTNKRNKTFKR